MTWTYSGDPDANPKDAVRFFLGDTEPDDPQFGDQEILYLLKKNNGNIYLATADGARSLAGRYSRRADKSVGDLRLSLGQQAGHYWDLAKRMQIEAGKRVRPYAGGITRSDKKRQEQDLDLVEPAFKRDMMENPNTHGDNEDRRRGCT